MNILIVNDDSITAPGIALLARVASQFGRVTVVAPARECSAMSQKLTLRESMVLEKVSDFPVAVERAYRLDGTPVDCVKVALECVLEEKPDYVFSGINNGYNVGYDIAYSGTLGAAFEARRCGIPAIAFSIASNNHLPAAEPYLTDIIRELLCHPPAEDSVWNVNFPALGTKPFAGILWGREVAATSLFRERYLREERTDGSQILTCKGIPTPDDAIAEGTDAKAVRSGYISIGTVKSTGR